MPKTMQCYWEVTCITQVERGQTRLSVNFFGSSSLLDDYFPHSLGFLLFFTATPPFPSPLTCSGKEIQPTPCMAFVSSSICMAGAQLLHMPLFRSNWHLPLLSVSTGYRMPFFSPVLPFYA